MILQGGMPFTTRHMPEGGKKLFRIGNESKYPYMAWNRHLVATRLIVTRLTLVPRNTDPLIIANMGPSRRCQIHMSKTGGGVCQSKNIWAHGRHLQQSASALQACSVHKQLYLMAQNIVFVERTHMYEGNRPAMLRA